MTMPQGLKLVERDAGGVDPAFRADVLAGLSQPQKAVPARWFYDDAGSALFEAITRLPEYYLTRAETAILERSAGKMAALIGPGRAVVEFGSGSSLKTPLLLSAIAPAAYVPIDISGDFLRASAAALAAKFPGLPVHPVEADFMRRVELPGEVAGLPKLGFFPGSTIGNFVAATATDLLRAMRAALGEGALLLIGVDLVKDRRALLSAYDDAEGVTAAFNRNLLHRINRELDGDIPVDRFAHQARWNDAYARIEMHLAAQEDLAFSVSGARFAMRRGETIHTENSHKYRPEGFARLCARGGWDAERCWTDPARLFSVWLLRAG